MRTHDFGHGAPWVVPNRSPVRHVCRQTRMREVVARRRSVGEHAVRVFSVQRLVSPVRTDRAAEEYSD